MTPRINQKTVELRKIQALHKGNDETRTYTIALPIKYVRLLGIEAGDFIKVSLEDQKLILQKAEVV